MIIRIVIIFSEELADHGNAMPQPPTGTDSTAKAIALPLVQRSGDSRLVVSTSGKRGSSLPIWQAATCPQTGLPCAARCLLYVGGRVRLCRHYRALAEQNGWSFMHHDGGLEAGLGRLAAVLPRADAVICPVDCVSHGAMQRIRHFCKQSPTQLVLLRSASLSAFARALERLPATSRT